MSEFPIAIEPAAFVFACFEFGTRDEAHFRGQVVAGENQLAVSRVEGEAAPVHAAYIARKKERSFERGRREDRSHAELAHFGATPVAVGFIHAPGVFGANFLRSNRSGL